MSFKARTAGLLALAIWLPGYGPSAHAQTQFPNPARTNADARTLEEFRGFYDRIEKALQEKDIGKIMTFHADDYLHHGITKKQLKFMWLEVFGDSADLYSVHVFTKITIHGDDAILVCTGGLFGIAKEGEDYTTVDQWVTQNHWLTKVDGEWKMIGGATHQAPRKRGQGWSSTPSFRI